MLQLADTNKQFSQIFLVPESQAAGSPAARPAEKRPSLEESRREAKESRKRVREKEGKKAKEGGGRKTKERRREQK